MSTSKSIYKMPHYSTAQHELVFAHGGSGRPGMAVRRLRGFESEELLFRTLPYALASDDTAPLAAWCRYFAETER